MLASDVNNPQFVGAQDPDSVMIAQFYIRPVKNEFKSRQENRPIFEDVLFCKYSVAGNTLLENDVPATEGHKTRFHRQWAYYERTKGGDSREVGTPLDQWTLLSPADVENLRGMKFRTIENIASATDSMLQVMGMGAAGLSPFVLRARAQAYIGAAQDTALPQKQAEEIEQLKKDQAERDAKHVAEMAELRELILAQGKPAKRAKREWSPEQKAAASQRMANARAAKQHKVE